jgi:hypothetical protein
MNNWLRRLFRHRTPSHADSAFGAAMRESGKLILHMREASNSNDVFRAMMADIWAQHRNVSFMTTVYEAVQEMKSGTDQPGRDNQDGDNQTS